jgi:hypothetical protein
MCLRKDISDLNYDIDAIYLFKLKIDSDDWYNIIAILTAIILTSPE